MAKTRHIRQPIDVTYSQLVTLIDSSGLTEGQEYRITDYQTVHTIPKTTDTNTSEIEPLIVTALSSTELKPEAYSENHPGDVIYYNIENDTSKVPGCTKGYIYRRIDTLQNNDFPFDFRNVKFRRWQISVPVWDSSTTYSIGDYMTRPSTNEVYISLSNNNTNFPYNSKTKWKRFEFDNLSYISPTPDSWDRYIYDMNINTLPCSSLYEDYNFYSNPSYYLTSLNNKITSTEFTTDILSYYNSVIFGDQFLNNNIKSNFYENSIKSYFAENNIGIGFYNNSIGSSFSQNSISNYFNNNSISGFFAANTIGERFESNIIAVNFSDNILANWFCTNSINERFQENNISHWFSNNIIGGRFNGNSVGNYFTNNTIGNYFEYNNIGDGVYRLITPDKTSTNTAFKYNTLKGGIGDGFITTNFTGATHVFEKYHCDIFVIFGGSIKLSYFDENGALVVVDANS